MADKRKDLKAIPKRDVKGGYKGSAPIPPEMVLKQRESKKDSKKSTDKKSG